MYPDFWFCVCIFPWAWKEFIYLVGKGGHDPNLIKGATAKSGQRPKQTTKGQDALEVANSRDDTESRESPKQGTRNPTKNYPTITA